MLVFLQKEDSMHPWDVFSSRSVSTSLKIVIQSMVIGGVIGAIRSTGETLWIDIANGALIGFVISLGCLLLEFQLFSNPKRRITRRLRPIMLMALRGATYSLVIVFGVALPGLWSEASQNESFPVVFAISAFIAFAFSIGMEITRLLGKEATTALISGRYQQARLEDRVILFADVVGSTALAERIGQLQFHDFLRDVAQDLAEAVEATKGDVHKYVGDAVIVTWPMDKGIRNAACLVCAQKMHHALEMRASEYQKQYGTTARLRVAIHCGEVAAGEIGDWKKEIALLGDPMNTTARIEGAAKAFNADIVISDELARRLPAEAKHGFEELPHYAASGKQEELVLWSAPLAHQRDAIH